MTTAATPVSSPVHLHVAAEPLLVDAENLARLLGIGRTLLDQMAQDGRLGPQPLRLGRRVLYSLAECRRWIEAGAPPRVRWTHEKPPPA